jgi:uncharacterized protein YqiB (DUF1249 family)
MSDSMMKRNYLLLAELFDDVRQLPARARSVAIGGLELRFELLLSAEAGALVSLAQGTEPGGAAEPEMELELRFDQQTVEALSYQDAQGIRRVYPTPGCLDPREYARQNEFLNLWLIDCKTLRHSFRSATKAAA